MEVVEEHDRRSAPHDRLQRGVDGLGHRRPVAVRGRSPELGQEGSQVRLQGTAFVEPVRIDAEQGPQHGGDRAVRGGCQLWRVPPQEERARGGQHRLR